MTDNKNTNESDIKVEKIEGADKILEAIGADKGAKVIKISGTGSLDEALDKVREIVGEEVRSRNAGSEAEIPEETKAAVKKVYADVEGLMKDKDVPCVFSAKAGGELYGGIGGSKDDVVMMFKAMVSHDETLAKYIGEALASVACDKPDSMAAAVMTAGVSALIEHNPGVKDTVGRMLGFGEPRSAEGEKIPAKVDDAARWLGNRAIDNEDFGEAVIRAALFLCAENKRWIKHLKRVMPTVLAVSDELKEAVEESIKDSGKITKDPVGCLMVSMAKAMIKSLETKDKGKNTEPRKAEGDETGDKDGKDSSNDKNDDSKD